MKSALEALTLGTGAAKTEGGRLPELFDRCTLCGTHFSSQEPEHPATVVASAYSACWYNSPCGPSAARDTATTALWQGLSGVAREGLRSTTRSNCTLLPWRANRQGPDSIGPGAGVFVATPGL